MMNLQAPLNAVAVAFVALTESSPINDLGPLERVVSYIGVLGLGWFFWRRETSRTDKTLEDVKAENRMLRRDNKDLEKDIRELLKNRQGKRYVPRSRDRAYFENLEDDDDELDEYTTEDKE